MRVQLNFKEGNFASVTRTAIILVLITVFFRCSREPEQIGTKLANPTSFIFPYGKSELTSAIEECFGNFKYKGFSLCSKNGLAPIDTTTLFDQEGNSNDFYLHPSPGLPVGKSRQYLIDGDSIDYFVSFHLHLTEVSSDQLCDLVQCLNGGFPFSLFDLAIIGSMEFGGGGHFLLHKPFLLPDFLDVLSEVRAQLRSERKFLSTF